MCLVYHSWSPCRLRDDSENSEPQKKTNKQFLDLSYFCNTKFHHSYLEPRIQQTILKPWFLTFHKSINQSNCSWQNKQQQLKRQQTKHYNLSNDLWKFGLLSFRIGSLIRWAWIIPEQSIGPMLIFWIMFSSCNARAKIWTASYTNAVVVSKLPSLMSSCLPFNHSI